VRDFEAVRVFSPTAENREAFAEEFDDRLDADVSAVASASEALDGADVVITATTASEPVIDDADVEPGTHVTAMGQYHPKKNELPPELIARATYVPDIRARAAQDAGSFLAAIEGGLDEDHVAADLGEVVAGEHPGRTSDDEVTVFDSGGTGPVSRRSRPRTCFISEQARGGTDDRLRARERGAYWEVNYWEVNWRQGRFGRLVSVLVDRL